MSAPSIAPGLLLAMPRVPDPLFARSVVLLIEHNSRGSFGLIVNKPTDIRLTEALEHLGIPWPEPSSQLLWNGGPVMPGPHEPEGYILHHAGVQPTVTGSGESGGPQSAAGSSNTKPDDSAHEFLLYPLPPHPDTLEIIASEAPERLRFFMGYSAWSPGQLEIELRRDAWLLAPADPTVIFGTSSDRMWESAIRSLGIEPCSIVSSSGVH